MLNSNRGIHRDWCEGFMKYAAEMVSDAMMYRPSFIKIGSGIPKLIGGNTQTAWRSHKHTYIFKVLFLV
jgi:hypothetical protein